MPDDTDKKRDQQCDGLTPAPLVLPLTGDDFRGMRALYKELPAAVVGTISDLVKTRTESPDPRRNSFIALLAFFVAYSHNQQRDRKLVRDIFNLSVADLRYLRSKVTHDAIECPIEIEHTKLAGDMVQPELFGEAPKTHLVIIKVAETPPPPKDMNDILTQAAARQAATERPAVEKLTEIIFKPMLVNEGTNALQRTTIRNSKWQIGKDDDGNDALLFTRKEGDDRKPEDFAIMVANYKKFRNEISNDTTYRLYPSTHKLYDAAMLAFTAQNAYRQRRRVNYHVSMKVSDYLREQGKATTEANIKDAMQRIQADINALDAMKIKWRYQSRRERRFVKGWLRILSGEIIEGRTDAYGNFDATIRLTIGQDLGDMLLAIGYVMQYPTSLLTIDDRDPNAYLIGRALCERFGNATNREKGNNDIISMKNLLAGTRLPDKETVQRDNNRRYKDYIITPFLGAMQKLESKIGLQWKFCRAGKRKLQAGQDPQNNIDDFLAAYIRFSIADMPTPDTPAEVTQ